MRQLHKPQEMTLASLVFFFLNVLVYAERRMNKNTCHDQRVSDGSMKKGWVRMVERTLAIIKPDAVKKQVIGKVIQSYEAAGLHPIAMKMMSLSQPIAEGFYAVHCERPFFHDLTTFMSSGPSVVLVLEGENAIQANRDLMGATDPQKAGSGTIRASHGTSIEANAVHGSDSPETARFEIGYFFPGMDL